MALVLSGTHSSSPALAYELHAEQTGGSGNNRTVKVTLKLKCTGTNGWFGYAMNYRLNINGTWNSYSSAKGTETWRTGMDWRSYSWTTTTNVGTTSSKAITVGFQTDSLISNSWDTTKTGNFTVQNTNTPPYFSSSEKWLVIRNGSISGADLTGIIPENVSTLYAHWGYASDNEGGAITYILQEKVNNGGWNTIDTGTDRSHGYNIGTGNEGQKRQLWVTARDSSGSQASEGVYSATITKNTLTAAKFTGHSNNLTYGSTGFTLYFSGANNTDGSAVKCKCYSDDITIHNATWTTSNSQEIKVWKSGATPAGPYIKFEDLKNRFKNTSYNGTLHVGVQTQNNYGTVKKASGSISVDLRTNPTAVTSCAISKDPAKSTAYKTVANTENKYFLPDNSNVIRVEWEGGSCNLGSTITYELFYSLNNGGWNKIGDFSSGTKFYNHSISKRVVAETLKYKVRVRTSFNYTADRDTLSETLNYYNAAAFTAGTITRGATTADVSVTVKNNTSIPNLNTIGEWKCYRKGVEDNTGLIKSGSLTMTQNSQIINITGLTDEGLYTLIVNYNDSTGFSTSQTARVDIGANLPIFFVNKYGASVGGVKASSSAALAVKGNVSVKGKISSDELEIPIVDTRDTNPKPSECGSGVIKTFFNNMYGDVWRSGLTFSGWSAHTGYQVWQLSNPSSQSTSEALAFRVGKGDNWNPWRKIYHEGNKPNWQDVGSIQAGNWATNGGQDLKVHNKRALVGFENGQLHLGYGNDFTDIRCGNNYKIYHEGNKPNAVVTSNGGGLYEGNGDTATAGAANVQIKSWFGVGFAPSIGGQDVPQNQNAVWINVRSGDIGARRHISCLRFFAEDWYYSRGNTGWYNETYKGGLYMQDSTWIRTYGAKNIYCDGSMIRCAGDIEVGGNRAFTGGQPHYKNNNYAGGMVFQDGGYFRPTATNSASTSTQRIALGHGDYRWTTVYCNSLNQSSDRRLKEDIIYLSDINELKKSNFSEKKDFYEFFKERFKPAIYKRKDVKDDLGYQVGFIAQDLLDDEIGNLILDKTTVEDYLKAIDEPSTLEAYYEEIPEEFVERETPQGTTEKIVNPDYQDWVENMPVQKMLGFDTYSYTTTIAIALQETIKELEEEKRKRIELEERIKKIEESLGL